MEGLGASELRVPLALVSGYLIGSIPFAQLASQLLAGVDLRRYGSGNVGASNLWVTVSRWAVVPVGLLEIFKGAVAVLIARALDLGVGLQALSGIMAMTGHNWSLFLGFTGGRGIGVLLGLLAVLAPLQLAVFAAFAVGGWLLGITPVAVLLGVLLLPLSSALLGEPAQFVLATGGVAILVVSKRVTGQGIPGIHIHAPWREILFYRLLLDRDVRDRAAWVHRRPEDGGREPGRRPN